MGRRFCCRSLDLFKFEILCVCVCFCVSFVCEKGCDGLTREGEIERERGRIAETAQILIGVRLAHSFGL